MQAIQMDNSLVVYVSSVFMYIKYYTKVKTKSKSQFFFNKVSKFSVLNVQKVILHYY